MLQLEICGAMRYKHAGHSPAFNSSRSSSLTIACLACAFPSAGVEAAPPGRRFLRLAEREDFSSASRRSMSATSCENDRNRTSACASVLSSSIVMLSSLQYWREVDSILRGGIIQESGPARTFKISSNCEHGVVTEEPRFEIGAHDEKRHGAPPQDTLGSHLDAILGPQAPRKEQTGCYSNPSKVLPKAVARLRMEIHV